ncbi:2-C-methyl-D-erythritol 4-phosphate cytidylyltransferase [Arthrobacter sp. 35W]|uniref:2-C-methyl-D-erythritol 4-phosphate cytidylyltransferase n=1 Tax=Arthrobacter sp. 35W TaxID=1132441 RepID=UPI00047DFEDB|nr:2-C-methyl-D-erythritol 4-phosphate cytidylyltransferase [Arthrobacter sp. 35W]
MNESVQLKIAVLVVAAGSGERLGHGVPKARVPLGGEPMLVHSLRGILAAGVAHQIAVAVPTGDEALRAIVESLTVEAAGEDSPQITVVDGGSTRAESVAAALAVVDADSTSVLIHDAARPLTPAEVYHRVVKSLAGGALAVVPALAVVDTVKTVTQAPAGSPGVELVSGTPARSQLRAIQTPQGFDLATLRQAHSHAAGLSAEESAAITDDAMLVEAMGVPVYVVHGSAHSLKITTPTDLLLAEAMLQGPLAPRWVEG